MADAKSDEERYSVSLTNLDQPLFDGAGATKRDLVEYLDAVADRILPVLEDRPLSVIRVHRGQEVFMQKNVPKYTPEWVPTVTMWAESWDVSYALCNDRRTLLWFANQRAVEYHPTLVLPLRMVEEGCGLSVVVLGSDIVCSRVDVKHATEEPFWLNTKSCSCHVQQNGSYI